MKTLNKAVARYNGISLIVRILIGLIVGAVLALVAPGAGWVGEFGNLFVGALKGIAPVLVFVIVASALAQGSSKLDRRFGTVIWLYMLTTFLAAAIAVVTSFLFPVTVVLADAAQSDVVPQGLGEVLSTEDRSVQYAMLNCGYVDAVAAHETAILQYMQDCNADFRILEEPLLVTGIGVAFALNDTRGLDEQLTKTFAAMRADGTMKQIVGKYLPDPEKYLEVDALEP